MTFSWRPGRRSDDDGDYLRAITGPAALPAEPADVVEKPADDPLAGVIVGELTLPDGLTLEQAIAVLAGLTSAGRLVGPHRIVTVALAPTPAPPAEATPAGSDLDRLPDSFQPPADEDPILPDPVRLELEPAPPTKESVALLIGELNGRPVTADQLRMGLRIAPTTASELRDFVNEKLFPRRAGMHGT